MIDSPGNKTATGRDAGGRFLKGTSGNDSGRPKGTVGLAAYIKAKTTDGEEIADFMMGVMRGENIKGKSPKISERIEAARWLADRAWGRSLQQTDINVRKESFDWNALFENMTEDEVMSLVRGEPVATLEIDGQVMELDSAQQ